MPDELSSQSDTRRSELSAESLPLTSSGSSPVAPPRRSGGWQHLWGQWRGLRWGVIGGLLLAALGAGVNSYLLTQGRLLVVNGLPQGMNLMIDGQIPLFISEQSFRELNLPEGRHTVKILVPLGWYPEEEFEFHNSWRERFGWQSQPLHVLNPGRTAALTIERTRQTQPGAPLERVSRTLTIGQLVTTLYGIDLPFEDFPARAAGTAPEGPRELTSLSLEVEELGKLLHHEQAQRQSLPVNVLRFAEAQLLSTPGDIVALGNYCALAVKLHQGPEALGFLAKQLARRPPWYEWHRCYQTMSLQLGLRPDLLRQYDQFVDSESGKRGPAYSGMLYLRGRLEQDDDASLEYMRRAVEANAGNYFAWHAAGFIYLTRGELDAAFERLAHAYNQPGVRREFQERFLEVAVAAGKHKLVRRILERDLSLERSADLGKQRLLLDAIFASGDKPAIERSLASFAKNVAETSPGDPHHMLLKARLHLLYLQADFKRLVEESLPLGNSFELRQGLFELDRLAEISPRSTLFEYPAVTGHQLLLESVASHRQQHQEKSEQEFRAAIQLLRTGSSDEQELAEALEHPAQLKLPDIISITVEPHRKAVALLALLQRGAAPRKELLQLIGQLNYGLHFPHHFINRVAAEMKATPPQPL